MFPSITSEVGTGRFNRPTEALVALRSAKQGAPAATRTRLEAAPTRLARSAARISTLRASPVFSESRAPDENGRFDGE